MIVGVQIWNPKVIKKIGNAEKSRRLLVGGYCKLLIENFPKRK